MTADNYAKQSQRIAQEMADKQREAARRELQARALESLTRRYGAKDAGALLQAVVSSTSVVYTTVTERDLVLKEIFRRAIDGDVCR